MHKMENKDQIVFSDKLIEQFKEQISHYPEGKERSATLSILFIVQEEYGWLSVPLMDKVAEYLHLEPIQVYEVATFYSMYNLKPVGKYKLEFCRTSCCCLRGAEDILEYTLDKLGIKEGETTEDGLFTVTTAECLGACGYAPMMQVGENYIENLTKESIDEFIDSHRKSSN